MSILVVGADHLGGIEKNLASLGFTQIRHVSGRKATQIATEIPRGTDMVLVLTDYVNHNLASAVKEQAKQRQVSVVFARRSWSWVSRKIDEALANR